MKFSLMFFASSDAAGSAEKYALVLESARFADRHGFESIWVPERHFNAFGHLYPNPAVLQAAVARETQRLNLRAGSVVLPLHHPIRVVEEWAMVDNLSQGRVGISFAPGWNPDDFAFFPDRYPSRYELLYAGIDEVRALWSGTKAQAISGRGLSTELELYPRPVQSQLPIWITAAGTPSSFEQAGAKGANLLTHLLDQGIEKLAQNIALFRQARARAGCDPGQVTLMLHTFVGPRLDEVHPLVRGPYCDYLKRNLGLLRGLAFSRGQSLDLDALSSRDLDELVGFLYDRFATQRGLIGTPESCMPLLHDLAAIGVDEVACLLDFGPADSLVLEHLPWLNELTQHFSAAEAKPAATHPYQERALPPDEVPWANRLARLKTQCAQKLEAPLEFSAEEMALIQPLFGGEGQALALVRAPQASNGWTLDPAQLELCCKVFLAAAPAALRARHGEEPFVPCGAQRIRQFGALEERVWSYVQVRNEGPDVIADLEIFSESGQPLAILNGLRLRQVLTAGVANPSDRLFYELTWLPVPLPPTLVEDPGDWLILADQRGLGRHLAELIQARGGQAWLVEQGQAFDRPETHEFRVQPGNRAELERVIHLLPRPLRGAAFLWGRDTAADPQDAESFDRAHLLGNLSLLALVQALEPAHTPLWIVTEQAQALPADTEPVAYPQAALWGFGRAVIAESNCGGGMIDLCQQHTLPQGAALVAAELCGGDREDQIAYRAEQRMVARLARAELPAGEAKAIRPDVTYLLCGGLGDLGLVLARALLAAGARHLLFLARALPDPTQARDQLRCEALTALEASGCRVYLEQADVADGEAMAQALSRFQNLDTPPIRGVFHLAARVSGAALQHLDAQNFNAAFLGKARGAWNLHRIFADQDLDLFVLYSAIPGLLGQAGVGAVNYSAANALLDGLAVARQRQGLAATSLAWGPWREVGMAARAQGLALLAEQGLGSINPQQGETLLARLFSTKRGYTAIVAIDWERFAKAFPNAAKSPFLSKLVSTTARTESAVSAEVKALRAVAAGERPALLETYLLQQLATLRARPFAETDRNTSFTDLGLDSLALIALRNRLVVDFNSELPIILFFNFPSVTQLAQELAGLIDSAGTPEKVLESEEEWVEGEL